MDLSIVIVSYNVKFLLEQCLTSVKAALAGTEAEVFVVDNHSSDGTVDYIKSRFPEVTVIANSDNPGFAKANNQAIRQSTGKYILLLNPDTVIGEENLFKLLYFMNEHSDAGAVGVRMIDAHGIFLPESKRSFPSPQVSFCKIFGLTKLFPHSSTFGRYYLPHLDDRKQHKIEVLAGAYMMLRREALDKAGLLDEDFFMYGEDIDLSYRIILNGYNNYYVPENILHYKGESTHKGNKMYVKAFYDSMLIFYRKHYPKSNGIIKLLIRSAIGLIRFLALIVKSKDKTKIKRIRHRRALILSEEDDFEAIKKVVAGRMPELEFINLWDLSDNRALDAICRRNKMKCFTDVVFCFPTMRFDQMILMMDKLSDKKVTYHIYNKVSGQLCSPGNIR